MTKVIQVRDVPDEVHKALAAAARARGMSLSRYLQAELSRLASVSEAVRHNAEVLERTRERVGGGVDTATIVELLREDRDR